MSDLSSNPRDIARDVVGLRDYVDTMFAEKEKALQAALLAQEKAVSAALMASDKAITKAEANAEKWRENANEWRGAMSDRDRELPSRREVETVITALTERITALEKHQERSGGLGEGVGLSADVAARFALIILAVLTVIITIYLARH